MLICMVFLFFFGEELVRVPMLMILLGFKGSSV